MPVAIRAWRRIIARLALDFPSGSSFINLIRLHQPRHDNAILARAAGRRAARAGLDNPPAGVFVEGVFEQLTILAPGLLGGSVAKAARQRGLTRRIVLWSRRPENRVRLRTQSWCDEVRDTPEEAVRGAGLVVLAAPVDKIITLAQTVGPRLAAGTLVTDEIGRAHV